MPPSAPPTEPRPERPEPGECCRGDCGTHCVFEVYERALERWQQAVVETPPSPTGPLS